MQIIRYNENSDAPSENSQPIENNAYNNNYNNFPTNNDDQFSKYIGWFSNVFQHVYSSIFYGTDTDYDNGQYSSTQSYSPNNNGYTQSYSDDNNNNGFTQSYNSNGNGYTQSYSTNDDGYQQEFYVDDVKDLHFSHQHGSHSTEFTATSSHGHGNSGGDSGDDSNKDQSR